MAKISSPFVRCFDVQITESGLTPGEMLKLFDSTGFEGVVSSSDISKALAPLISEGAKAWIRAESQTSPLPPPPPPPLPLSEWIEKRCQPSW
jgi:hypothetical protein